VTLSWMIHFTRSTHFAMTRYRPHKHIKFPLSRVRVHALRTAVYRKKRGSSNHPSR